MSDTNNIRKLMNIVNEGLFDFLDPMKAKFDRSSAESDAEDAELDSYCEQDPEGCKKVTDAFNANDSYNCDDTLPPDTPCIDNYEWLIQNTAPNSPARKYGEAWLKYQ